MLEIKRGEQNGSSISKYLILVMVVSNWTEKQDFLT